MGELLATLFPARQRGGKGSATRGGFALERQVATRLRQAGAVVVKSGGSRGPYDLVAIWPGLVLGIQVKRGERYEWSNPIPASCCFIPLLLQRVVGGWRVRMPTA